MSQPSTSTGFIVISDSHGAFPTFPGKEHRTRVVIYDGGLSHNHVDFLGIGTRFGFVLEGSVPFSRKIGGVEIAMNIHAGMYWSFPGCGQISPTKGEGKCVIIESDDFHGLFLVGGPVEQRGRLKYIDGATDTLIIPPVRMGDPCLNYLHFPPNTRQTSHTHPSLRLGVVFRGRGRCILPNNIETPLEPGMIFAILPDSEHAFFTDDQSLEVIAYHPDSDFGPQDINHPVINRTLVDGKRIQTE